MILKFVMRSDFLTDMAVPISQSDYRNPHASLLFRDL